MKTLIIALQKDGKLVPASFELIEVAKSLGGEVTTVVLAENAEALAGELAQRGGGQVLAVSSHELKYFNDEIYVNVLSSLISKHTPDLVLGPATFYGKSLVSRLAARNGAPMASDVSNVSRNGDDVVVARSHYGGSVISNVVRNSDKPFLVTVRPKIYPESKDGDGRVVVETVDASLLQSKMVVKELKIEATGAVSLTEADIIVSAGRGMKGPEHLPIVRELADVLGAAFGASRAIVDAGWIPYSHQVGQTGKTVNPKLYVAVGISGAIQHLVGMRTSGTIVAVNKDKDAPIFNIANYGIVGDAFEIVPALTRKFKQELAT
ncbi:MAG: electron transfer flavoprotein subunit alpha/FixB family protein [candidate division Zixibacteria bacterium]|nr:electron transfer flavoprotein subunit alpha/FixB family protein [candidate division Zixibacteria bacterium]